tara:strand:- start:1541 stop:1684 length:144 start_codon:yes stop_codon:yes gene_type:complete
MLLSFYYLRLISDNINTASKDVNRYSKKKLRCPGAAPEGSAQKTLGF